MLWVPEFCSAASCPSVHSEESFLVQDYARTEDVLVQRLEPSELALPGGGNRSSSVPHPFRLTLQRNSEGRRESVLLSAESA